jgi:hypothetical protein
MKQILLLSGYARSGKDSVANLLEEECGFRRFAFADALKEMVAAHTGIPVSMFHSQQKDTAILSISPKTYRDLLIEVADQKRAIDPDIFSRIVASQIVESDASYVVISDWRYKREESFLRSILDPATYHIQRGRVIRSTVIPSEKPIEHDLDGEPMDVVIPNDGSISDLRDAVHSAVSLIHPSS